MPNLLNLKKFLLVCSILAVTSAGGLVACSGSEDSGDEGSAAVSSTSLARVVGPIGAQGRALSLNRVEIPPGAEIAPHFHEGTQIANIDSGTLTYTVKTGKVTVMEGPGDDGRMVHEIRAGQTGEIEAGQWIVEQPDEQHAARNDADQTVVIYLANLLKKDAEAATPVP